MNKLGEIKLTLHIYKNMITGIDTEVFVDGKWEKAIAPKHSPAGDIYPGWNYVMPVTYDTDLHIKMMMRHPKKEKR